MSGAFLPGATIGVLGSGQLGRMLALAARRMGYRVHVFSPEADSPAGRVANREWGAPYDDLDAARAFAGSVDVVTLEFENIPAETVEEISSRRARPAGPAGARRRRRTGSAEKEFLRGAGFPVAPFRAVPDRASLDAAIREVGRPPCSRRRASATTARARRGSPRQETPTLPGTL